MNKPRSLGMRLSDLITRIMGSWSYVFCFLVVTLLWVIINHFIPLDPYPHQFLNLLIGILSVLAAPLIMMSQNRQEERDRLSEEQDLASDLRSEELLQAILLRLDTQEQSIREINGVLLEQLAVALTPSFSRRKKKEEMRGDEALCVTSKKGITNEKEK